MLTAADFAECLHVHLDKFWPPVLHVSTGLQSVQRLLEKPLHTDPLISIARHKLKFPFLPHVGFEVGATVGDWEGLGTFVGLAVGCFDGAIVVGEDCATKGYV